MTNKDYRDVYNILKKLQKEFIDEEDKLIEFIRDNTDKIDDLNNEIDISKKNEDIDYRVFSPRNISMNSSDKITSLEEEKSSLERSIRDAERQKDYYNTKTEKINKVLFIISKELDYTDEIKKDPFDFIEDNNTNDEGQKKSTDIISDDSSFDTFDELFKNSKILDQESDQKAEPDKNNNEVNENTEQINDKSDTQITNTVITTGIPVNEVETVYHKVEFTEKIVTNDRTRAKLELKKVVLDLKNMIDKYKK